MRKNVIIAYAKKICKDSNVNNFEIILDTQYNIGNGYCDNYYDSNREIRIGIKELKIKSDLRFAQIYNNAKEKLLSSIQKFTQYPKQRDEIDINLDEIL